MTTSERLRVVLIGTTHPGNIGATARAMKTMGLKRLYLVQPQVYPHAEATARAAGADDVLAAAVVCDSLAPAIADCALVLGTSARQRHLPWPEMDARQAAERAVAGARQDEEIAFLFGRERFGLTNEELDCCQAQIRIPSNPEYASLNLAAAVQILSHEIRMADLPVPPPQRQDPAERPARQEDLARFYAHLEQALIAWEFLDPDQPKLLLRRLRRLFARAEPTRTELNILRGILTAAEQAARRKC